MRVGDNVGQYRVTALLGEGGMGEVYKAIDTMIDREVAVKVLRPEISRQKNLLQRFRAEAVTLARLNCSGIAMLYSFMQQGDDFFMILEYVPGKTLEAVERERGALPYRLAVPLLVKVLEAMQYAHEMGILHRDIKPANIMLTTWGTVKLMDFGIARVLGAARQTREGSLVGTMEYLAPERVRGSEGDAAADIYALGVLLYEMLAGRLPFLSDNEYEMMRMHLETPAPAFRELGVEVPEALEAVVRQALAKKPEDRFASCDAFAEALQGAVGSLAVSRQEVVALVGQMTISQLGTAGHSLSSSADLPDFQAASQAAAPHDGSPAGRPKSEPAPSAVLAFAARRKAPLLAGLAALVAITIGIVAGVLSRRQADVAKGADENRPAAIETMQRPAPPAQPAVPEPVPAQTSSDTLPLEPQPVLDVSGSMSPGTPPPPAKPKAPIKHRDARHEQSIKALDQ